MSAHNPESNFCNLLIFPKYLHITQGAMPEAAGQRLGLVLEPGGPRWAYDD